MEHVNVSVRVHCSRTHVVVHVPGVPSLWFLVGAQLQQPPLNVTTPHSILSILSARQYEGQTNGKRDI